MYVSYVYSKLEFEDLAKFNPYDISSLIIVTTKPQTPCNLHPTPHHLSKIWDLFEIKLFKIKGSHIRD